MATPDAIAFFTKVAPQDFVNEACARIILRPDKYRPIKYARDVRCPVLLQICEHGKNYYLSEAKKGIRR
jgi:hypothetical protein